jgi:hypothetical protein
MSFNRSIAASASGICAARLRSLDFSSPLE